MSEMKIESQSESIAEDLSKKYGVHVDCSQVAEYLRAGRDYALQLRAQGLVPDQSQIATYVVQYGQKRGDEGMQDISKSDLEEMQRLLDEYRLGVVDNDPTPIFTFMKNKKIIDGNVEQHFNSFYESLKRVKSEDYNSTVMVIDEHAEKVNQDRKIGSDMKGKLLQSFDGMRNLVCAAEIDSKENGSTFQMPSLNQKDDCTIELCFEQHTWVMALIVVFMILTILILIFTFFFPPLAAIAVAVAVWTAVAFLVCERLDCEPEDPCPNDGEEPFCQGNLAVFNATINKCEIGFDALPSGVFTQNDCLVINRPTGQPCPSGTTNGGAVCLVECFTFDNGEELQQDNDGRRFLFDFICQ